MKSKKGGYKVLRPISPLPAQSSRALCSSHASADETRNMMAEVLSTVAYPRLLCQRRCANGHLHLYPWPQSIDVSAALTGKHTAFV